MIKALTIICDAVVVSVVIWQKVVIEHVRALNAWEKARFTYIEKLFQAADVSVKVSAFPTHLKVGAGWNFDLVCELYENLVAQEGERSKVQKELLRAIQDLIDWQFANPQPTIRDIKYGFKTWRPTALDNDRPRPSGSRPSTPN